MLNIDFAAHNAAAKKLWDDYWAGRAERVPMTIGCNPRMIVADPQLNTDGHCWEQVFADPAAMIEVQADLIDWRRHHMLCDEQLGPVERYDVGVTFLNCYDALYLGAPLHFREGQIPDTEPFLFANNRNELFKRDWSAPLAHPWVARSVEFYDYMMAQRGGWQRNGKPLGEISPTFLGSDGPFTAACGIRPPDLLMTEMLDDPQYVHRLLDTITDAIILRIKALRAYYKVPTPVGTFGLADDAVMMLSPKQYRDFVLPCHRRMIDQLCDAKAIMTTGKRRLSMHLCGDAAHLFKIMVEELGINQFDTGFPIDHGRLRRDLGPDIWIQGGPTVQLLKDSTPQQVFDETRRILQSGIKTGRKFMLREGNNSAPCTPMENIEAMYRACVEFGRFE